MGVGRMGVVGWKVGREDILGGMGVGWKRRGKE